MVSDGGDGLNVCDELDTSRCSAGGGGSNAAGTGLVEEGLVASSTLERATLTRRTARKLGQQFSAATAAEKPSSGSGGVFWTLVAVLLLLALSNLALTFFAMGVLRLGAGMESIEFITGNNPMLKLFGLADLGLMQQHDGVLSTYANEPLTITGDNSQVSIGVNTIRPSPAVHVAQHSMHVVNVNKFQVVSPSGGQEVFSTERPSFGVPRGVHSLHVERAQTPRVVSPTHADLGVRADSTIRVKGNEGVTMSGRTLEWNADQDIFLRSLNGSLVLDGGAGGLFVEVNNLPLAGPVDHTRDRGQYKLCVCHKPRRPASRTRFGKTGTADSYRGSLKSGPSAGDASEPSSSVSLAEGHLFRVPVPLDNARRSKVHQINCASFTNPCMMM